MIPSWMRTVSTTVAAVATGVKNAVTARREKMIELQPGDVAPEFVLAGSDGLVYRLSDYAGSRAVVLAWFPKAFTGG
jgi:thioredoxin-dependent peroxiredoxin